LAHGDTFEEAESHARAIALERKWRFLHPFDDPDVIAGQGTLACELGTITPDVVLVPVGGGGLAAGVGIALRGRGTRIIGVQLHGMDAMARSLARQPALERVPDTIADGLRVRAPGELTRALCEQLLDDVVLVTEEEVRRAMLDLMVCERIVAEGAGATAVAAVPKVRGRLKVAVVSGGNVDHVKLRELLGEHVSRDAAAPDGPI
jgi:threonine dehydratase